MFRRFHKFALIFAAMVAFSFTLNAQKAAVKTNLVYWGTTTPTIGMELGLGPKTTLELGGGLNLFTFKDEKRFKHWLFQPELRYWTCEKFNGHFFGLHAHGAQFNVGGWDIPVGRLSAFKDYRYEGFLYGAGVSYGYQWVLNPSWNFEANLGGGFARIHYDKFPCVKCGGKESEGIYNYFGVTKVAVSLIYFIK